MTDDDFKQKRNKPCESCRTHRRRCILLQQNLCERCHRMVIPCFFKFSTTPNIPKKPISASKKNRLFKKIWLLEQDATLLETELHDLATHRRKQLQQQQQQQTDSASSWQVCIRRLQHQLVMETNITNIGELFTLMQQLSFNSRIEHIPIHSTQPALPVTLKITPFEKAIRELFTTLVTANKPTITPPLTPPLSSSLETDYHLPRQITNIKRQLIDIYFSCLHIHHPILIKSYYHSYMHQHLDDMITWAIAAYTAYTSCHHVSKLFRQLHTWTRQQIGEFCRLEAKRLFDETIFSDPSSCSVTWIFTAYLLAQCACCILQNRQAHIYANLAWQMTLQLKPTFVPDHDITPFSIEWILAETWRRIYPSTRFLAISFNIVNEQSTDLTDFASHSIGIAFPHPHPSEQVDLKAAVLAYHDLAKLHHVAFLGPSPRVSTLNFHLYSGKLSSVHSNDALAMETRFIEYWYSLPPTHRLASAPLDTIHLDLLSSSSPPPPFLRVNATYYLMLMSTMLRFMPSPSTSDLTGVSIDRMDGPHALLVVSICCDATIKIYKALLQSFPCMIELHWLTFLIDTAMMLIHAKDPLVRQRALIGARIAKDIFLQIASPAYSHTLPHDILAQRMDAHLKDSVGLYIV